MLEYLFNNKEWLFSGVGVAAISWVLFKTQSKSKMKQRSGKNSTNIQIGGSLEIKEINHNGHK